MKKMKATLRFSYVFALALNVSLSYKMLFGGSET